MAKKFRFELKAVNQGPFKMYQIIDNKYNPPRVLMTTSDSDEAHKYIQEEVHNG